MIDKSYLNYIIVGVAGTIVYLLSLTTLVELFKVDPVVSAVSSYIPVFFGSYFLTHSWVFNSDSTYRKTFFRYFIVIGLGFLINSVGIYLAVTVLGFWYLSAQGFLFILVAINNYLLNRFWAFERDASK